MDLLSSRRCHSRHVRIGDALKCFPQILKLVKMCNAGVKTAATPADAWLKTAHSNAPKIDVANSRRDWSIGTGAGDFNAAAARKYHGSAKTFSHIRNFCARHTTTTLMATAVVILAVPSSSSVTRMPSPTKITSSAASLALPPTTLLRPCQSLIHTPVLKNTSTSESSQTLVLMLTKSATLRCMVPVPRLAMVSR